MGSLYTFKCNKCNYSVQTSGEHDVGMVAVTNTYVCNSCKEIVDVLIGLHGETFLKEEIRIKKEQDRSLDGVEFYRCPQCGSDNITEWDTQGKSCPKCHGNMSIDENGEIILWD